MFRSIAYMNPQKKPRRSSRRHNDNDPARTGLRLRQLRLNKEITQAELATAIGFKNAHSISHIETGYRAITDGKLIKAATYLGVAPSAIRKAKVTR
jgi:transcriptional regulator with XRE-family HTH domain